MIAPSTASVCLSDEQASGRAVRGLARGGDGDVVIAQHLADFDGGDASAAELADPYLERARRFELPTFGSVDPYLQGNLSLIAVVHGRPFLVGASQNCRVRDISRDTCLGPGWMRSGVLSRLSRRRRRAPWPPRRRGVGRSGWSSRRPAPARILRDVVACGLRARAAAFARSRMLLEESRPSRIGRRPAARGLRGRVPAGFDRKLVADRTTDRRALVAPGRRWLADERVHAIGDPRASRGVPRLQGRRCVGNADWLRSRRDLLFRAEQDRAPRH